MDFMSGAVFLTGPDLQPQEEFALPLDTHSLTHTDRTEYVLLLRYVLSPS